MTTKPPRQREGKPFAGGKKLRKALAKLAKRKDGYAPVLHNGIAHRRPGSMK